MPNSAAPSGGAKISKVRSKLVGNTDISWVRTSAPRFVTSVTLQERTPSWPLKKSRALFSMRVLPTIVHRYQDPASFSILTVLYELFVLPATPVMSAPHAPAH
jgi:hypothetical protein